MGAAQSISSFRVKRFAYIHELIESCFKRHGRVRIVDLGGTCQYWSLLSAAEFTEMNIELTIINITEVAHQNTNDRIEFITADACELSRYSDNSFELVHSNSVIEHVGTWERMQAFAAEVRRLAPVYYIQTPNFWFPLEPHHNIPFFHWLPLYSQVWLLQQKYGIQDYAAALQRYEGTRMLSKRALCSLFPDSAIQEEKFLFLTKSFMAIRS